MNLTMKKQVTDFVSAYIRRWDFTRLFRLLLGVALLLGYLSTKESIYLAGSVLLGIQAIFNLGCAGPACSTGVNTDKKEVIQVKELDLTKDK